MLFFTCFYLYFLSFISNGKFIYELYVEEDNISFLFAYHVHLEFFHRDGETFLYHEGESMPLYGLPGMMIRSTIRRLQPVYHARKKEKRDLMVDKMLKEYFNSKTKPV